MCVCVSEIRKENSEDYTPRTISMFLAGLQRYISEKKGTQVWLSNPNNPAFKALHSTLENCFRELHSKGIGTKRRQADIVSAEEEEQLRVW